MSGGNGVALALRSVGTPSFISLLSRNLNRFFAVSTNHRFREN